MPSNPHPGGELAPRSAGDVFAAAARAAIAAKRSPNTRAAYERDLARWLTFCEVDRIDPRTPSLTATTRFRDHLATTLSAESARRGLAACSAIYRALLRGGVVGANPFHPAVLAWPAANEIGRTRAVADDAATRMIKHAETDPDPVRGARDAAVLRLLYDTGLRRSSVASLLRSKVRDGRLETIVKGGKTAELELPAESRQALAKWLAIAPASPYVFPGRYAGHMNLATINLIVRQRGTAIGDPRVHPHSFRAAFVTAGYDAGLSERELQEAVHHADPTMTRRYDRHARGQTVATQVAAFRSGKDPKRDK